MLEIFSDIICPWCYIGKVRFERALELCDSVDKLKVVWRPFQLNPNMPKEGVSRREYRIKKFGSWEYSQQLDEQVLEAAKSEGLDFNFDITEKTPNTLLGHKLIKFAENKDCQDSVVSELFNAFFCEGKDIGDRLFLLELAGRCGLDKVETTNAFDDAALETEVKAEEMRGRVLGINGVPAFVMNEHVLFSGAQQPHAIAEKLKQLSSG
jgi:predicted DsbA family dithiol-disulfide isomerase